MFKPLKSRRRADGVVELSTSRTAKRRSSSARSPPRSPRPSLTRSRSGFFLIGPPGAGKTEAIRLLDLVADRPQGRPQSASGSPRSRRRSKPGTSTQELTRRSDGDRRERVDWGRACGLAELPLSNPRGAISPPPSPILSTRTARWFSNGTHRCVGRGSTCRQGEWNMRRGHDRRRPVDISALPRKLRKGEVEGTGRESGWRRGERHHRQPTGPSHLPISVGGSESVSPLDRDLAKRGRAA
jgi:hypothetical protein